MKAMRVFLAEDNPNFQEQFKLIARAISGQELVFIASTETAATSWLEAHMEERDLAVVDIFLAQGNGFNILKLCAARPPHQKMVVVSNYDRGPVREQTLRAGADAFFDKLTELDKMLDYCQAAKAEFNC